MDDNYRIIDLQEEHLSGVLRICRQELGEDYHGEADFRRCLEGGARFCKVALDADGQAMGFAVAMVLEPGAADEFLKLPASPERDRLLASAQIGILDAAAVDPAGQGAGLGRRLAQAMYAKLSERGAEVVCAMAWKSADGHTNAARIVEGLGMEEALAVQGYWNRVVASPEGHHCPVCGEPPCRCFGVLYVRRLAGA